MTSSIWQSNGRWRAREENLTQAARALGISRSTLYRKVERYHLDAIVKPSDE